MRQRKKPLKLCLCFVLSLSLVLQTGCATNPLVSPKTTFDEPPSSEETYKESPFPEDEPAATVPQVFVEPEYLEEYSSIIEEYRDFIDYLINDKPDAYIDDRYYTGLGANSTDDDALYHLFCMMVDVNLTINHSQYIYDIYAQQGAVGYTFKDLNGDGNPELIMLLQDYSVLAIYTISDGQPKLLDAYWPKRCCGIDGSGLIYVHTSVNGSLSFHSTYQVSTDGSELVLLDEFGTDSDYNSSEIYYYQVVDGERRIINKAEYDDLLKVFPTYCGDDNGWPLDITKDSGIGFIPLYD